MSDREEIAVRMLEALFRGNPKAAKAHPPAEIVMWAFQIADAVLAERKKP